MRFFQRNKTTVAQEDSAAFTSTIPDGQRIYAVGDIHGRYDLLLELETKIAADAANYTGEKTVIYLGDYIDRGLHSCDVLEHLSTKGLRGFKSPIHLMGNHELIGLSSRLTFTMNKVSTCFPILSIKI